MVPQSLMVTIGGLWRQAVLALCLMFSYQKDFLASKDNLFVLKGVRVRACVCLSFAIFRIFFLIMLISIMVIFGI